MAQRPKRPARKAPRGAGSRSRRRVRKSTRRQAYARARPPEPVRKHSVRAALKVPELTKARTSLKLEIFEEGEKVGELEIGRGGFFWKRGKGKKSVRLSWERFIDRVDRMSG